MDRTHLAGMIDHALLAVDADDLAVTAQAKLAVEWGCAAICVRPARVAAATRVASGSHTRVCTVIGFPRGDEDTATSIAEIHAAAEAGADEFDIVMNWRALLAGRTRRAERAAAALTAAAHAARPDAVVKLIVETGALDDVHIALAGQIAVEAGADFVKTSTGYHAEGATVAAVRLLRTAAPGLGVKASGGIHTLADATAMIDAGASRLGTSHTRGILAELAH